MSFKVEVWNFGIWVPKQSSAVVQAFHEFSMKSRLFSTLSVGRGHFRTLSRDCRSNSRERIAPSI